MVNGRMIDTDKYEGHTGPWKSHTMKWLKEDMVLFGFNEQDAMLSADAPLHLEEVKRLRRVLELIGENMKYHSWMHTLIKEAVGYEKVIE